MTVFVIGYNTAGQKHSVPNFDFFVQEIRCLPNWWVILCASFFNIIPIILINTNSFVAKLSLLNVRMLDFVLFENIL